MVQMISHGFISGAMFLCVGVLYDRLHSRQIADYGGVVNKMPIFSAFLYYSRWPTLACQVRAVLLGNLWLSWAALKSISGTPSLLR